MRRRSVLANAAAFGFFAKGPLMAGEAKLHVPAEEHRHAGTFLMWPVNRQVHPDMVFLDILQDTIANIANAIAEFEPVIMLAAKSDHAKARKLLSAKVELWDIPTEDLWARDAGPLFAWQDDELVISHIQFDGWGKKQVHSHDAKVAMRVAERLGLQIIPSGLYGEAGGVEHDGHGLLIAHESSWIEAERNPGMTRNQVERKLLQAYGADRMIWSPGVQGEDITDYHIDSLARFTGPGRVLINLPDTPDDQDPFHMAALDTHDALEAAGLDIEVIPEPNKRRINSIDFVASYANYYVCNGAIIAPQFGDRTTDQIAIDALHRHYPGREVVTLNVDALGEVGGGIHCATQQIPA